MLSQPLPSSGATPPEPAAARRRSSKKHGADKKDKPTEHLGRRALLAAAAGDGGAIASLFTAARYLVDAEVNSGADGIPYYFEAALSTSDSSGGLGLFALHPQLIPLTFVKGDTLLDILLRNPRWPNRDRIAAALLAQGARRPKPLVGWSSNV